MNGSMSIFRKPINKVLGDPVQREIKRYQGVVDLINELEPEMSALTDEELRDKTREFRGRLGVEGPDITHGQSFTAGLGEETEEMAMERIEEEERDSARRKALDDLLPEAFAVVREAAKRTLGMRHFDVQLIGGIVLHQGRIAEMKTGEGKTLVATLALYLNALEARGAHLVTVNDYLARRDAGWNAALFHFLGLSVGVIAGQDLSYLYDPDFLDETHPDPRLQHLRPVTRREAYAADITYSTNNELGFDYLRDNMAQKLDRCVQRRLRYAIVDEVDSILIDEARTPLIISGQASEATDKFYTYARLIPRLVAEEDYTIDEKTKSATLTEEGVDKIEKWTGISNVYEMEHAAEAHQINQALRAHALWLRDKDYIVRDGEVIIVDEFTGRTMPGRRWSDGLHQAIEAKEGVAVQQETVTLATITFQNFFRLYDKLAGMTGTALTEAEEFHKIYKLEVVPIPTHQPMVRLDEPDLIYRGEEGKYRAVVDEIAERNKKGQPILVGTTSIEKSERLSRQLDKLGVQHSVLNAKLHEREADVIANAGQRGSVTIATNMAGRGTDIVLGEGVADVGGLYIIGTERHESRRIDNQLRGRAGRQGDPGRVTLLPVVRGRPDARVRRRADAGLHEQAWCRRGHAARVEARVAADRRRAGARRGTELRQPASCRRVRRRHEQAARDHLWRATQDSRGDGHARELHLDGGARGRKRGADILRRTASRGVGLRRPLDADAHVRRRPAGILRGQHGQPREFRRGGHRDAGRRVDRPVRGEGAGVRR